MMSESLTYSMRFATCSSILVLNPKEIVMIVGICVSKIVLIVDLAINQHVHNFNGVSHFDGGYRTKKTS